MASLPATQRNTSFRVPSIQLATGPTVSPPLHSRPDREEELLMTAPMSYVASTKAMASRFNRQRSTCFNGMSQEDLYKMELASRCGLDADKVLGRKHVM